MFDFKSQYFLELRPVSLVFVLRTIGQFFMMLYGRFRLANNVYFKKNTSFIGKLIELELERRNISVTIPMAADWGYIFRLKVSKQLIDVSVVDQHEDGYGIALEPQKNVLNVFLTKKKEEAIKTVKSIVSEVLHKAMTDSTLIWYTKDEWLAAFGTNFWQHQN